MNDSSVTVLQVPSNIPRPEYHVNTGTGLPDAIVPGAAGASDQPANNTGGIPGRTTGGIPGRAPSGIPGRAPCIPGRAC